MGECSKLLILSKQARSLWAKTDQEEGELWLPLFAHLCDTCLVMDRLYCEWLPSGIRRLIAHFAGNDESRAFRLVRFLAAAHDIGKATPAFQAKAIRSFLGGAVRSLSWKPEKAGLPIRIELAGSRGPSHSVAGQVVVERYFGNKYGLTPDSVRSLSSIVGSHHGKPPGHDARSEAENAKMTELGWDQRSEGSWRSVQFELLDLACALSGFDESDARFFSERHLPIFVESILCGLVIMADWIASNQSLFPLVNVLDAGEAMFLKDGCLDMAVMEQRATDAWEALDILPAWEEPDSISLAASQVSADSLPERNAKPCVSARFNEEGFAWRFGLPEGTRPRPLQKAAVDLASSIDHPGIMVIEAPMGEGKTEAALAAAEILCVRTGRGGVCVALPTMATTDAMFGRVHTWLNFLPCKEGLDRKTMYLAHGKAQLNEEFQGIVDAARESWLSGGMEQDIGLSSAAEDESVVVSNWMLGRKKGMLANFVVCTVDQVLMGSLAMKHLPLRQLALANKVVAIDECHAYDAYMQQYLASVLSWLGAWRTPVILLSATLPSRIREELVAAYVDGRRASEEADRAEEGPVRQRRGRRRREVSEARSQNSEDTAGVARATEYPLITYSDGLAVKSTGVAASGRGATVALRLLDEDEASLAALLAERLSGGGCAGIICSTVTRAQRTAAFLARRFGNDVVALTHARFMDIDRMQNEIVLREKLGPKATVANGKRPHMFIVVGTQVLEQSLDIDFDVMVTDVAPADLLMQRLGRLHRHARGDGQADRPEKLRNAGCFVRGIASFEEGIPRFGSDIEKVYSRASLLEALAVLSLDGKANERTVSLPHDISPIVQKAYGSEDGLMPPAWYGAYQEALRLRSKEIAGKIQRAKPCLIKPVNAFVAGGETMEGMFSASVSDDMSKGGHGEERGQLAVRDTQETIEVLLAWRDEEGEDGFGLASKGSLRLLPWVGDSQSGVSRGACIPTSCEPPDAIAKVFAQCSVRLPLSLCRPEELDNLINELEESCGQYAIAWMDSRWLSGRLALILERDEDGELAAYVRGQKVLCTRGEGLRVEAR